MKKALVIVTAGLLLFGGLAWAQMQPGMSSGMMQQQAAADGAKAGTTHGHPKQGMGSGMMGNMMRTMMAGMRGNMMGSGAQDSMPLFQRLVQQRKQLGLSPEQVQQVQAIASQARKARIRHTAEIQVAEIDLSALMQADPVDLPQVEDAVKRLESQRTERRLARLSAVAKVKTLLTPEQRQQLSTQMAATSQTMPGEMGCPMMSRMMGHRSAT